MSSKDNQIKNILSIQYISIHNYCKIIVIILFCGKITTFTFYSIFHLEKIVVHCISMVTLCCNTNQIRNHFRPPYFFIQYSAVVQFCCSVYLSELTWMHQVPITDLLMVVTVLFFVAQKRPRMHL